MCAFKSSASALGLSDSETEDSPVQRAPVRKSAQPAKASRPARSTIELNSPSQETDGEDDILNDQLATILKQISAVRPNLSHLCSRGASLTLPLEAARPPTQPPIRAQKKPKDSDAKLKAKIERLMESGRTELNVTLTASDGTTASPQRARTSIAHAHSHSCGVPCSAQQTRQPTRTRTRSLWTSCGPPP